MKYKYLFLLSFFVTPPALAAEGLGRLFFSPEQRVQLDLIRARRDPRVPVASEAEPIAAAPTPAPPQGLDTVTYNGLVRRSDGKSTVWINGKAVDERHRIRGAHEVNVVGMRADGAVSVAIPQASRTASLRVGQRLDVESGRIEEGYARRTGVLRTKEIEPPSSATARLSALTPAPAATPTATESASARRERPVSERYLQEAKPESGAAFAERAATR